LSEKALFGGAYGSLVQPGDTESSEDESILDKLRTRNPQGAADVDIPLTPPKEVRGPVVCR
jgi:hypothetical protein